MCIEAHMVIFAWWLPLALEWWTMVAGNFFISLPQLKHKFAALFINFVDVLNCSIAVIVYRYSYGYNN